MSVFVAGTTLSNTFTVSASWGSFDAVPRLLADVNGDGKADIVGFANNGVVVALSTGSSFASGTVWFSKTYTLNNGGWYSFNKFPRFLADVNGDGRADIVGFSSFGVSVSLSTGSAFGNEIRWNSYDYAVNGGKWTSFDAFPRLLADVNGDGKADVVGFNGVNIVISYSNGSSFPAAISNENYGFASANGWTSCGFLPGTFPIMMQDINGDGRADIVGLGYNNLNIVLAAATPTFGPSQSPSAFPTYMPSLPTVPPTTYPTNPTISPTTHFPTTPPTFEPTIVPTSEPTFSPSSAPTPFYLIVDIGNGDLYLGSTQRTNYVINVATSATVTGGNINDKYTILPHHNSVVTITDFDSHHGIIDLTSFTDIVRPSDLVITNDPNSKTAIIALPNNQRIMLSNHYSMDILPGVFIFYSGTLTTTSGSSSERLSSVAVGIISAGVPTVSGVLLACFSKRICTSAFDTWNPGVPEAIPGWNGINVVLYPCSWAYSSVYLQTIDERKKIDQNRLDQLKNKKNDIEKLSQSDPNVIAGGGEEMSAYFVHEILYDNPVVHYIQHSRSFMEEKFVNGGDMVNLLIEIGHQDKELAHMIVDEIKTSGIKHVFEVFFENLYIIKDTQSPVSTSSSIINAIRIARNMLVCAAPFVVRFAVHIIYWTRWSPLIQPTVAPTSCQSSGNSTTSSGNDPASISTACNFASCGVSILSSFLHVLLSSLIAALIQYIWKLLKVWFMDTYKQNQN